MVKAELQEVVVIQLDKPQAQDLLAYLDYVTDNIGEEATSHDERNAAVELYEALNGELT